MSASERFNAGNSQFSQIERIEFPALNPSEFDIFELKNCEKNSTENHKTKCEQEENVPVTLRDKGKVGRGVHDGMMV